jgi:phosphate transport system permease protein
MSSVIAKLLHETSSHGPERAVLISLGFLLMLIAFTSNLFARRLVVWIAQRSVSSEGLSFSISSETQDEFLMEGSARRRRNAQQVDRLMSLLLGFCQLLTMIPLFLILGFVAYQGISAINWNILLQLPPPIDEPGGLGHALLGSTMLVGMAAVWTIPLSLLAATLLVEFRSSRLCRPLRFTSETLGGIPSIVVGIFAYSVLVSPFWWPRGQFGFSAWAGAFALGMIMLPILIRMAEESLLLVPRGLREASYALGATQWQTVSRVLLPAALPAILTGILLAIGRAVGEAAPLLLTSRGSNFWPRSPAEPTASLPYFINEFSQQIGQPEFERLGWAGAFLLLVSIFCINMMTRVLAGRRPILY